MGAFDDRRTAGTRRRKKLKKKKKTQASALDKRCKKNLIHIIRDLLLDFPRRGPAHEWSC